VFDRDKLNWLNGHYIRELAPIELAKRIRPFLDAARLEVDNDVLLQLMPVIQIRIKTLPEVVALTDFFFVDIVQPTREQLLGKAFADQPAQARAALQVTIATLKDLEPFDAPTIEKTLRAKCDELGLKAGNYFTLLREAVTAKSVTPPLFDTLAILGKERTMARLTHALKVIG
jgi:glutamyl-tRNA synthetase